MRKWFFVLPLVLLMNGCTSAPAAPPAPAPPSVAVVPVVRKDVSIYGEWVGTLDGYVNTDIKAQVTGYLIRRDYKEGLPVHKGQLLFEIDPRPFEAALAQAEGQLTQTRGQLAQANSQLQQAQAVLAQANSQLQAAEAGREQAQGQLLQAQAALLQAQAGQRKTDLDLKKYRPLAAKKAVTQQDLDNAQQADLVAKAGVAVAQAQVATARGAMASAKAQIGTARAAILSATAQISTAHSAITTAEGQVQIASAQVDAARLNLSFTRIVSPIEGIAGVARAQVGDLVTPSSEALTVVSKLNPVKVIFTVSEQEYIEGVRRVRVADPDAGVEFALKLADGSTYPYRGRFYSQDRNVAVTTGAMRITALFPNPNNLLRPGQYARIRAVRYVAKGALLVPQRAVNELQDAYQVAVVGPDNKVSFRTVHVGDRIGKMWIVKDGLKAGERVITEGLQKVGPGMPVSPQPFSDKLSAAANGEAASPSAAPSTSQTSSPSSSPSAKD